MTRNPVPALRRLAALAALALPLAGCFSDQTVPTPDLTTTEGLFQRYVAMGNSITAGFQSGGINDSTQRRSYAVLLAQAANAPFFRPTLNMPGCPAPWIVNTTTPQTRVGTGTVATCALREPNRHPYLSNVAVPGARAQSILDTTAANQLTQFILGGRTQVQAMMAAQPTFVSLWIGNNELLNALTATPGTGNPGTSATTPTVAAFQATYGAILDSIQKTGAKAVLIGTVDITAIPYSTPGNVIWCLRYGGCPGVPQLLGAVTPLTVANSCAPIATGIPGAKGDSSLVPWPVSVPAISAAAQGAPRTIDCSIDNLTVLPAEFANLRTRNRDYNAYIQQQAQARGWAYWDPNPVLLAAKAANDGRIATFPTLPTGAGQPNVLFGSWMSLDGVHPATPAHRVATDSLIAVINRTYGTTMRFIGP